MATSKTDIANFALSSLSAKKISDIADSTVKNARVMTLHYDQCRKEILRLGRWNFATRRKALSAHADAPPFGYDYQYPLPVDFVRLMNVNEVSTWESANADWFDIEDGQTSSGESIGSCLLVNIDSVRIRYIADVEDATQFDPLFIRAFRTLLAASACRQITGSDRKEAELLAQFDEVMMPMAQQVDGAETRSGEHPPLLKALRDSFFVRARRAGAGVEYPEPVPPTVTTAFPNPNLDEVDVSGDW